MYVLHCPGVLLQIPDHLSRLYVEYSPQVFHLRPDQLPIVEPTIDKKAAIKSRENIIPNTTPTVDAVPLKQNYQKGQRETT